MPPLGTPLANSKFTLNSAGVAGFFGGKEAIQAMATVHLYEGRRYLGWYNSPGSYTVAKRFGRMANSRFWDGLFPGPNDSPAVSFGLDGKKGPKYIAALSGTTMETGHLAYLTLEKSKEIPEVVIEGRETRPVDVAYLSLNRVDYDADLKREPATDALLGLIPITVSVVACIMCGLVCDWFSFSMILLGIVSSGLASLIIGKGKLRIVSVKNPAEGAPPGHGVLLGDDIVVVVKGDERDVNAITKGRFDLQPDKDETDKKEPTKEEPNKKEPNKKEPNKKEPTKKEPTKKVVERKRSVQHPYHAIGMCSLLLIVQFLLQLLLIPQGTLFGQIMFLVSLGISWGYTSYLSSLEKEKIQTRILFHALGDPPMLGFRAGTRTTMAVFVCLLLFHGVASSPTPGVDRERREKILNTCLPNDTAVWRRWKEKVVRQLLHTNDKPLSHLKEDESDHELSVADRKLLNDLLGDAHSAFNGYFDAHLQ